MESCDNCGVEFLPKRFWQKFCSKECHEKFWARVRKEAAKVVRTARETSEVK